MNTETQLQSICDDLAQYLDDPATMSAVGSATLLSSLRFLARAQITVLRAYLSQPKALNADSWRALSCVDATCRLIWLKGRPMKGTEIHSELAGLGCKWLPARAMTLIALLHQSKRHLRHVEEGWALTEITETVEGGRLLRVVDQRFLLVTRTTRAGTERSNAVTGGPSSLTLHGWLAGLTPVEAAERLLKKNRKAMRTDEILHAMSAGGWQTKHRNPLAKVYGELASSKAKFLRTQDGRWVLCNK